MTNKKHQVTLYELRSEDGEVSLLEAYVKESGELVLEGYDRGKTTAAVMGDSDYEYWRTVAEEDVPRVLLELIKDRFESDVDFTDWLKSRGIDYRATSWS